MLLLLLLLLIARCCQTPAGSNWSWSSTLFRKRMVVRSWIYCITLFGKWYIALKMLIQCRTSPQRNKNASECALSHSFKTRVFFPWGSGNLLGKKIFSIGVYEITFNEEPSKFYLLSDIRRLYCGYRLSQDLHFFHMQKQFWRTLHQENR